LGFNKIVCYPVPPFLDLASAAGLEAS